MMVDLTAGQTYPHWLKYTTGFYFQQSDGHANYEVSGTNAEVIEGLHNIPKWDEDYERYTYHDALDVTESQLNVWVLTYCLAGEMHDNWWNFGFDFPDMPARALKLYMTPPLGDTMWGEPVWMNVMVSMKNPATTEGGNATYFYLVIDSRNAPDGYITYDYLQTLDSRVNPNTTIYNIEFNPSNQQETTDWQFSPDPICAEESTDYTSNTLKSSWFVMDMERTRSGQYLVKLKRDIIADYYNNVLESPMLIHRAMSGDINNPLLYNSEGFSFNQIKKDEILLKDKFGTPWYVLYFLKDAGDKSVSDLSVAAANYDYSISQSIDQSIFGSGNKYHLTDNMDFKVTYRVEAGGWAWAFFSDRYTLHVKKNGLDFTSDGRSSETEVIWFVWDQAHVKPALQGKFQGQYTVIKDKLATDIGISNVVPTADLDKINWDGKIVKDSNNKLWKVHVIRNPKNKSGEIRTGTAVDYAKTLIEASGLDRNGDYGSRVFNYSIEDIEYTFSYEPATDSNALSWSLDWTNKTKTKDSDYNIVAIPYNTVTVKKNDSSYTIPGTYSRAFLNSIFANYDSTKLVDVQLLPYCPIQSLALSSNTIDITNTDSMLYGIDTTHSQTIFWLYPEYSNYTFNITQALTAESDAFKRKVQNETQLVRLVSPNYQGMFEFSVAKNNGVDYFNVDVTLKPYNPYIHINPNFKGIYGLDFNDARGLICGGDFSIPKWSSAWADYELRNKNYQLAFDRQIEHLDFAHGQERTMAGWNIATGTVQGATTGALAGAMVGGGWGAAIGGIVGGGSSLAGGIADYALLDDKQVEEKDYMMDQYRFQLGNIKALPNTINKVTPLTYNNKLFPFIEIYECTDEEKELFERYLEYRSMTIESVDFISNYIKDNRTFIQATPIRLENIDLTAIELSEIFKEFKQGVYI